MDGRIENEEEVCKRIYSRKVIQVGLVGQLLILSGKRDVRRI